MYVDTCFLIVRRPPWRRTSSAIGPFFFEDGFDGGVPKYHASTKKTRKDAKSDLDCFGMLVTMPYNLHLGIQSITRPNGNLRNLFHRGTWNAPTVCSCSIVDDGSHCCGKGLNVSLRARVDASELRRDRMSVGTMVKVSRDDTRCRDMVGCRVWCVC